MFKGYIKMAIASLRSTKWRSLLTMLGIVIGIVSVVTTVSLGEGIKHQVVRQINNFGTDLITVRAGNIVTRDDEGNITRVNVTSSVALNNGSLSQNDYKIIQTTKGLKHIVPISIISGGASFGSIQYNSGSIIATTPDMDDALKLKLKYGVFFTEDDVSKDVAVIGQNVNKKLFNDEIPIGMAINVKGREFIVRGVLDQIIDPPIALGPDFNNLIIIPYQVGQQLTGGNNQLLQVLIKPTSQKDTPKLINTINQRIKESHGGQDDFAVLGQDENLVVTNQILNALTSFIAGIAAISLLVGGIGIMNVMLVAVTERTREIGIRKALGATNQQILGQFLVEAVVLSLLGGVVGIILSYAVNAVLRLTTHLQPVITIPIVLIATGVSLVVGIIFGIMPAAKAASKDPIDALRYE